MLRNFGIFDKNSLEKLNFYLFLEKLLLKIEPSEITSFFYSNFPISGGGDVSCSTVAAPMVMKDVSREAD